MSSSSSSRSSYDSFALGTSWQQSRMSEQAKSKLCYRVVLMALRSGVTRIDTASRYGTESAVGKAIRTFVNEQIDENEQGQGQDRWDQIRSRLTVASKLWPSDLCNADSALKRSLDAIGGDVGIDCYLIHAPDTRFCESDECPDVIRLRAWRSLEAALERGDIRRSIGVSNFQVRHLQALLAECRIKPAVNQFELNPMQCDAELVGYCRKHDIAVEAYCPLAKGRILDDPTLTEMAERYRSELGGSVAALIVHWLVRSVGALVACRTSSQQHLNQVLAAFEPSQLVIEQRDLERIAALERNLRVTWDPSNVE
jgi:diketogulonate reductase-like aldo/keto reductase